jgi:acylphosphatase
MMTICSCIRIEISGKVQGVGFRWKTREAALALGISGWIKNRPDGKVEAVFKGEQCRIDEMLRWIRKGPAGAEVLQVSQLPYESGFSLQGFTIIG